jgi:predicted Zn-dependent peptidase
MQYDKVILNNKLRLILVPVLQAKSVTAMVLVGAGSRYETAQTNGLSHFLEHMVFKGSKKWPTAKKIASLIDGIGGEFNAYTGKEDTVYYIKSASPHLKLTLAVLSDITFNPLFVQKEIEKEKGVILEEINMYEDLPMRRVAEYFETLLYPNSPLGWDIAGRPDNIKNIKQQDFLDYRRARYLASNMVLAIVGGFAKEKAIDWAKQYFSFKTEMKEFPKPREAFVQEKPGLFLKTKKTDQTHLVCGVRTYPLGHRRRYAEAVLAAILGGGMSSRLFTEVREKRGLAYYVRTDVEHYLDNGYLATSAGVDTKRAAEAIKLIVNQYEKIKAKSSIKPKELAKAKEYLKGRFILEIEDSRNASQHFGLSELLEGKIRSLEEILKGIDKVSLEDINRVANECFQADRLNLAIIGPFEDKDKFERLLNC